MFNEQQNLQQHQNENYTINNDLFYPPNKRMKCELDSTSTADDYNGSKIFA